jgi:hypothetical protein
MSQAWHPSIALLTHKTSSHATCTQMGRCFMPIVLLPTVARTSNTCQVIQA